MAQTLPNGFVIPEQTDRIRAAGVQEMRTLGASGDARVGAVDLQSRARDADLADQVAGMEGMTYTGPWEAGRTYRINDVVTHGGDSWARLTAGNAGEPGTDPSHWGLVARRGDGGGFGELSETDVTGLWEGVAPGPGPGPFEGPWRDISTLFDPAVVTSASGVRVRRYADRIEYSVTSLRPAASGGNILTWGTLPPGCRPTWSQYGNLQSNTGAVCDLTANTGGGMVISGAQPNQTYRGNFVVYTTAAPPATHPGSNV